MEPIEYRDGGKVAEFNGLRFIRDDRTGYYLNSMHYIRLHRAVWEAVHGSIPKGYQIHHIDENKSNNTIENLTIMKRHDHMALHMDDAGRREFARRNIVHAIEAAREWHGTQEGREWHKKHYEESGAAMYVERDFNCAYCGKPFKSVKAGSRFCSNKCKTYSRKASGVDDITRTCVQCGKEFRVNKYVTTKCCSGKCAAQWRRRKPKVCAC